MVAALGAPLLIVSQEVLIEWEIFSLIPFKIVLVFIFDYISLRFLRLVSLISSAVLLFRTSYISSEVFFRRFLTILALFVASMGLLILRPNLISLLLG